MDLTSTTNADPGRSRWAREFFDHHGSKTIVLARFIPLVRTVLNPLAGTVRVDWRVFTLWQVVGGLVWTAGLILAAHELGERVQGLERFMMPIIAVLVVLTLVPVTLELIRGRRTGGETS